LDANRIMSVGQDGIDELVHQTDGFILGGISLVYAYAFLSFYLDAGGLYGKNGIQPVEEFLSRNAPAVDNSIGIVEEYLKFPSVVAVSRRFEMPTDAVLDITALVGFSLSCLAVSFRRLRISIVFAILLTLYLSLYLVGQTFLSFQWDILLLEVGTIAIVLAPFVSSRS